MVSMVPTVKRAKRKMNAQQTHLLNSDIVYMFTLVVNAYICNSHCQYSYYYNCGHTSLLGIPYYNG